MSEVWKAGPELDAEVARVVFEIDIECWIGSGTEGRCISHAPYSSDIAAAWPIIEHFRDRWSEATVQPDGMDSVAFERRMRTEFEPPFDDTAFFDRLRRSADRRWPWALLYLTPEAICRAALAALAADDQGPEDE